MFFKNTTFTKKKCNISQKKKYQYRADQKLRSMYSILMLITCCDQTSERSEMNRPIVYATINILLFKNLPKHFLKYFIK